MKDGFIHVCFIIDESGSMTGSESDVCGGFNKVIDEQKALEKGSCAVSLYRFETTVSKDFVGKPVSEIGKMRSKAFGYSNLLRSLNKSIVAVDVVKDENEKDEEVKDNDLYYCPNGSTAMNDGIGRAIDEISEWLSNMPEDERPEKNLIVIMTDGGENSSQKYSIDKVKEMIKHQAEVYNWSFVYMGTDITDSTYANTIMGGVDGCAMSYSDRSDVLSTYAVINAAASNFRNMDGVDNVMKCCAFNTELSYSTDNLTSNYERKIGKKIK